MRAMVSAGVGDQAVTFTSSESYERVMIAPEYAVPRIEPDAEAGRAAIGS